MASAQDGTEPRLRTTSSSLREAWLSIALCGYGVKPLSCGSFNYVSMCLADVLPKGDAESQILAFAEESGGEVEASVARPGLIYGPDKERRTIAGVPSIEVHELAAALLDQAVNGVGKDTMMHSDLVQLGRQSHSSKT